MRLEPQSLLCRVHCGGGHTLLEPCCSCPTACCSYPAAPVPAATTAVSVCLCNKSVKKKKTCHVSRCIKCVSRPVVNVVVDVGAVVVGYENVVK